MKRVRKSKGIGYVCMILLTVLFCGCGESNPYKGLAMDAGDFRQVNFGASPDLVKQMETQGELEEVDAAGMAEMAGEGILGFDTSYLAESNAEMLVYSNVPIGKKETADIVYSFQDNKLVIGTLRIYAQDAQKTYDILKSYYIERLGEASPNGGGCKFQVEGKFLFLNRNKEENTVTIVVMDFTKFLPFMS